MSRSAMRRSTGPSGQASSARDFLQQATKSRHSKLDSQLELLKPGLTQEAYVTIVGRYWQLYSHFEAALQPHAEALQQRRFSAQAGHKASALRHDLEQLHATLPAATLPPQNLPSVHHALGCLYVLEGSMLGALKVGAHLRRTLHLEAHNGASFFAVDGAATLPQWRAFCTLLNEHLDTPDKLQAARHAAEAVFDTFFEVLCQRHGA